MVTITCCCSFELNNYFDIILIILFVWNTPPLPILSLLSPVMCAVVLADIQSRGCLWANCILSVPVVHLWVLSELGRSNPEGCIVQHSSVSAFRVLLQLLGSGPSGLQLQG